MNSTHGVGVEVDRLAGVDVGGLDRGGLDAVVAAAGRVRAWLDGFDVRCARRARELAAIGVAAGPESTLTDGGRRTGKDAAAVSAHEQVCEAMPAFEAALDAGVVAGGHLDALARAVGRLDDDLRAEFIAGEADLLTAARSERVETFERRCTDRVRLLVARAGADATELDRQRARSSVKRWIDKVTGMHHTHLELDPIRDAAMWSAADARLTRLRTTHATTGTPWTELQLNAFIGTIQTPNDNTTDNNTGDNGDNSDGDGTVGGDGGGPLRRVGVTVDRVPEATLLIDHTTLVDGFHELSICELDDGTPIPLTTMRRMLCDCDILPTIVGTHGEVLEQGRSIRTANRPQRRALRTMHRTCAHPDCQVRFADCRIHHITWWWQHHGPTDLDNLIPLCERHHHQVHEGGWGLTMTPDRIATWTRPDGTIAHHGTTINRTPNGITPPTSTGGDPKPTGDPPQRTRRGKRATDQAETAGIAPSGGHDP